MIEEWKGVKLVGKVKDEKELVEEGEMIKIIRSEGKGVKIKKIENLELGMKRVEK